MPTWNAKEKFPCRGSLPTFGRCIMARTAIIYPGGGGILLGASMEFGTENQAVTCTKFHRIIRVSQNLVELSWEGNASCGELGKVWCISWLDSPHKIPSRFSICRKLMVVRSKGHALCGELDEIDSCDIARFFGPTLVRFSAYLKVIGDRDGDGIWWISHSSIPHMEFDRTSPVPH